MIREAGFEPAFLHGAMDDECRQKGEAAARGRHLPQHVSVVTTEVGGNEYRIAAVELPAMARIDVGIQQRLVVLQVGRGLRLAVLPEVVRAAADRVPDGR